MDSRGRMRAEVCQLLESRANRICRWIEVGCEIKEWRRPQMFGLSKGVDGIAVTKLQKLLMEHVWGKIRNCISGVVSRRYLFDVQVERPVGRQISESWAQRRSLDWK